MPITPRFLIAIAHGTIVLSILPSLCLMGCLLNYMVDADLAFRLRISKIYGDPPCAILPSLEGTFTARPTRPGYSCLIAALNNFAAVTWRNVWVQRSITASLNQTHGDRLAVVPPVRCPVLFARHVHLNPERSQLCWRACSIRVSGVMKGNGRESYFSRRTPSSETDLRTSTRPTWLSLPISQITSVWSRTLTARSMATEAHP